MKGLYGNRDGQIEYKFHKVRKSAYSQVSQRNRHAHQGEHPTSFEIERSIHAEGTSKIGAKSNVFSEFNVGFNVNAF